MSFLVLVEYPFMQSHFYLWLKNCLFVLLFASSCGIAVAAAEVLGKESGLEVDAGDSELIISPLQVVTGDLSPEKERFIAAITAYNESRARERLDEIRDYVTEHAEDGSLLGLLGRALVVDAQTAELLLDRSEAAFRSGDIRSDNSLGFMILRLGGSEFWAEASPEWQIRFEALAKAIVDLPPERAHPFTRYIANATREKLDTPSEPVMEVPRPVLQYLTRGQLFEILGTDYDALQSVGAMGQALEQSVVEYLPYLNTLSQPLWVRIQPGEAQEAAFQIRISAEGNVGVILLWSEQTSMDDVAEALSRALLQRIAIWRWGERGEEAVPYWLWRALAAEILTQLQPARNQGQAREIEAVETFLPLAELLDARAADWPWDSNKDQAAALQSLWFYRYLRDQASRASFGLLIEAFLSERSGINVLQRAFPDEIGDSRIAQEWWEVGLANLVRRQQGVVYSLERSNALVESLSGVTAWWQGRDHRLRGPALLPLRNDARWQSAFWRQQRELKLELQRINPIYFNTLLSLGQFYDLLLARGGERPQISEAERRAEAEAVYARFLEDWAYAQALQRAVETALEQAGD